MERLSLPLRSNRHARLEDVGISWADDHYWQDGGAYAFTAAEIDTLELGAQRLVDQLLETAKQAIRDERLSELGIPAFLHPAVTASWDRPDPAVYMRLDVAYDGSSLHLMECNGQTPTSLLEASVAQWHWLEDNIANGQLPAGSDQWNRIHEALIDTWKTVETNLIHFSAGNSSEDLATVTYLQDLATQAGHTTRASRTADIGRHPGRRFLVDLADEDIGALMWLWPFEFAWEDAFAGELASTTTRFIEPLWKTVLCSKGLLALLHERYPDDASILPASLHPGSLPEPTVHKPLFSREGQNVTLNLGSPESDPRTSGAYGDLPVVEQAYTELPSFPHPDGTMRHPVLGIWVAGQTVCGMGVRESASRITDNRASFVPHLILPNA